jgi:hypothetical protein
MSATSPTLRDVFSSALTADIDLGLPKTPWVKPDALHDLIKGSLAEHLSKTSVLDVLIGSWNDYRDLKKYLGKDAQERAEPVLLSLVRHTIGYTQHPSVQVLANNAPVLPSVKVDVTVDFTLEGARLKIQHRRIVEVQAGKIQCTGNIGYHGKSILKQELRTIELPGKIPIGNGASGE